MLAAYDLVMRAFPHLWAHSPEDNAEAIALLNRALALDPDYALAASLAGWAHGQQVVYNWTMDFAGERQAANRMIETAVRTIGDDPTALTALASAIMMVGLDVLQAAALADRALALDPNHAWAWMRRGWGQVYLGNPRRRWPPSSASPPARRWTRSPSTSISASASPISPPAARSRRSPGARRAMSSGRASPGRGATSPTYYAHAGDLAAARDAAERFVKTQPDVTVAKVGDGLRFMYPSLLARYLQGLQLAGLP